MKRLLIGLAAGAFLQGALAQGCSARSPAHTIALVELYTSEGCSSCPPADVFLSSQRGAGVRTDQAVMLSLHVDYWNDIGWKDPYSHPVFTRRQNWLSDLAHTRTVYTPEFFVAGKEARDWNDGINVNIKRVNATPARANIAISIGAPLAAGVPVQVSASGQAGAKLYLALVENGLATKVAAGENRGRILRHDYVVRDWSAPVTLGADGKALLARTLPVPRGAAPSKFGVTAFVQSEQGAVLQALSLDACGG
ncbi:MAG: DUF1223 domain-containing protein [Pseudomonadota bacterium]